MAQRVERVGFLGHRGHPARVLVFVGCLIGLSACESVPDYANPVKWYEGVVDWFDGAEEEPEAGPVPGADQPYPNLASVPEWPEQAPSSAEMQGLAEGLVADRAHAQYAVEVLRRSGEEGEAVLVAPAPAIAGSPPATPGADVTVQPLPPLPEPPPAPTEATAGATQRQAAGEAVLSFATLKDLFTAKYEASGSGAFAQGGTGQPTASALPQLSGVSGVWPAAAASEPTASLPLFSTGALEGDVTGLTATGPRGSVQAAVIQFAHGSAKLSGRELKILKDVVALHRSRGGVVRVVGHASRRTREMPAGQHLLVNYAMSLKRAQAVARELMLLGLKPEELVIVAKGDSEPLYYEWMPSGEAHNRRAEIYIDA